MAATDSISCEGINFGEAEIKDQVLTFRSQKLQKPIFQLNLDNISTCVIPSTNKDDVEIQFQESQDNNRDEDQLIQITFHFPSKKDQIQDDDEEEEPEEPTESFAEKFHKQINDIGLTSSITGEIIVEFTREQGNFVTPRGKYALQMTSTYMYMQGAQYFYKISYNEINSLFLLPKLDGGRMAFAIALEKPIRQGTQKYQYLVIETHKLSQSINVNLTDEQIENDYDGQLQKTMEMPLCNLIAKVFKVLTKKSVFIPKHFITSRNGHAVRCSLKANEGLLYPLAKAFIFINKPTVYIRFEDIEIIDFKRYEIAANSATRNFDLVISLKSSAVSSTDPKEYTFSSIDRGEYPVLIEYFQSKDLPVNKPKEVEKRSFVDDDDDGGEVGNDDDSKDSEEEDDDYVGADENDDDDEEDEDEGEDDGQESSRKKQKV